MKNDLLQFKSNIPSTNRLLSEMARKANGNDDLLPPFFALYTDFQGEGRGMGSNKWFSDKNKNLLVSFYFKPNLPASQQFIFNQYFAVTTLQFVQQFIPEVRIKWPNDLYIQGKKLAGDLTEHSIIGNRIKYTIAGIGINLNQEQFPESIPHPTSLWIETQQHTNIYNFLKAYHVMLYDRFEQIYDNPIGLREQYLEHLYQRNEVHHYLIHGENKEAIIRDIDAFGRLQLEDLSGTLHTCGFKEVVFL